MMTNNEDDTGGRLKAELIYPPEGTEDQDVQASSSGRITTQRLGQIELIEVLKSELEAVNRDIEKLSDEAREAQRALVFFTASGSALVSTLVSVGAVLATSSPPVWLPAVFAAIALTLLISTLWFGWVWKDAKDNLPEAISKLQDRILSFEDK